MKTKLANFCKEVCETNRFFYSDDVNDFLEELYQYCVSSRDDSRGNRIKLISEGSKYYRARAHSFQNTTNEYVKKSYDVKDMKPVPNMRSSGRLNAYNVNALYLAEDKNIAVSEVRASANAPISVAKFEIIQNLKVLKFDYVSDSFDWLSYSSPDVTYSLATMFSMPLDNAEHQNREYIPTQIIAEFFKSKGIDGIEYPSQFIAMSENEFKNQDLAQLRGITKFNLCLFDINSADCIPESIEVLKLKNRINIVG
ncbi:RES family NAD+ phosphorylase [Colwellia sp. RE-S-Sl-9]